jgi:threonine dehydrogenase-like Zn-dependent dehydrogenase
MPNHCLIRTVTGIISHDGAFAEEIILPAKNLHTLSETLDPVTATLIEPLAAALQTFVMTPVMGDETTVVIGPGRLGILIVFVAALRGMKVFAVSRSKEKRQRALDYGASKAWSMEEAEKEVKNATEGLGADIVVDATGQPEGLSQALSLVRPRGTIALKTTCGLPPENFDVTKLVVDEITLQGSRCGPFESAIELLGRHQEKLKKLISSIRPLSEIQQAVEAAFHEEKIIINIKPN